jgi:aspartyl-tRNA synthetase
MKAKLSNYPDGFMVSVTMAGFCSSIYGITHALTQCVVDLDSPVLQEANKWRVESVITITGKVKARHAGTENASLPTGEIEVYISEGTLQSAAEVLPFQVADPDNAGEDLRLK